MSIARQFGRGWHGHDPKLKVTLPGGNAVTEARVTSGNAVTRSVTPEPVTRNAVLTRDVTRDAVTVRDVTGELDQLHHKVAMLERLVRQLGGSLFEQERPVAGDRVKAGRMTPAQKQAAYRARRRSATDGKETDEGDREG